MDARLRISRNVSREHLACINSSAHSEPVANAFVSSARQTFAHPSVAPGKFPLGSRHSPTQIPEGTLRNNKRDRLASKYCSDMPMQVQHLEKNARIAKRSLHERIFAARLSHEASSCTIYSHVEDARSEQRRTKPPNPERPAGNNASRFAFHSTAETDSRQTQGDSSASHRAMQNATTVENCARSATLAFMKYVTGPACTGDNISLSDESLYRECLSCKNYFLFIQNRRVFPLFAADYYKL